MKVIIIILVCCISLASCKKIAVYEKRVTIPNYKWEKSFVPTFNIDKPTDGDRRFLYVIVRHTNNYPYSNLWLQVKLKAKDTTIAFPPTNVLLTKNDGNTKWVNKGMDDIYEVKQAISVLPIVKDYTFTIENIMQDNPLPEVLNVGLRIDKAN